MTRYESQEYLIETSSLGRRPRRGLWAQLDFPLSTTGTLVGKPSRGLPPAIVCTESRDQRGH